MRQLRWCSVLVSMLAGACARGGASQNALSPSDDAGGAPQIVADAQVSPSSDAQALPPSPTTCQASDDFGSGDFNGDGKQDAFCRDRAGGAVRVALAKDGGLSKETIWIDGFCTTGETFGAADVDGDPAHRTDVWCRTTSGSFRVATSNGSTFLPSPNGQPWVVDFCPVSNPAGVADATGDGRGDAWCHDAKAAKTRVAPSNGTSFVSDDVNWRSGWGCKDAYVDYTWDSLDVGAKFADLYCRIAAGGEGTWPEGAINGAYSDGTQFTNGGPWLGQGYCVPPNRVGTVRAKRFDGLVTRHFYCRDDATGNTKTTNNALPLGPAGYCKVGGFGIADIDGDGIDDVFCYDVMSHAFAVALTPP